MGSCRRFAIEIVTAVLVLVFSVVGCASQSPGRSSHQPVKSPAQAVPSSTGTATSPSPARHLTAVSLRLLLLQVSDLGPSFRKLPSVQADHGHVTAKGCFGTLSSDITQVDASFWADTYGPYVGEELTAGPSALMTKEYVRMRAAVTSCHFLSMAGYGYTMSFKISAASLGDIPGSVAVRMDSVFEGTQVNGYYAIDQVGGIVVTYVYYQFNDSSPQQAAAFFVKAVRKAESIS